MCSGAIALSYTLYRLNFTCFKTKQNKKLIKNREQNGKTSAQISLTCLLGSSCYQFRKRMLKEEQEGHSLQCNPPPPPQVTPQPLPSTVSLCFWCGTQTQLEQCCHFLFCLSAKPRLHLASVWPPVPAPLSLPFHTQLLTCNAMFHHALSHTLCLIHLYFSIAESRQV